MLPGKPPNSRYYPPLKGKSGAWKRMSENRQARSFAVGRKHDIQRALGGLLSDRSPKTVSDPLPTFRPNVSVASHYKGAGSDHSPITAGAHH